jgi:hypothetical protein
MAVGVSLAPIIRITRIDYNFICRHHFRGFQIKKLKTLCRSGGLLCLPIFFNGMTVFRWEGWLLLGYFALYTTFILLRASAHDTLTGHVTLVAWIVLPLTALTLAVTTAANLIRRARMGRLEPQDDSHSPAG